MIIAAGDDPFAARALDLERSVDRCIAWLQVARPHPAGEAIPLLWNDLNVLAYCSVGKIGGRYAQRSRAFVLDLLIGSCGGGGAVDVQRPAFEFFFKAR